MSAYNVTKAGVVALSESLMQECAGTGVRVTVAMPGFFPTNLLDGSRAARRRWRGGAQRLMASSSVTADEVASIILERRGAGRTHVVVPKEYRRLVALEALVSRSLPADVSQAGRAREAVTKPPR